MSLFTTAVSTGKHWHFKETNWIWLLYRSIIKKKKIFFDLFWFPIYRLLLTSRCWRIWIGWLEIDGFISTRSDKMQYSFAKCWYSERMPFLFELQFDHRWLHHQLGCISHHWTSTTAPFQFDHFEGGNGAIVNGFYQLLR